MKNLRSLTFAKNNIKKNVKERVLLKNYKERLERSLHLCFMLLFSPAEPNLKVLRTVEC